MRAGELAISSALLAACGRVGFDPYNGGGSADAAAPPAGLVARWKLDEGIGTQVADAIGSANGTLGTAGTSGLPTWTSGHEGAALHFAGGGDLVDLSRPAALANLPALTISGWVRPSSLAAAPQHHCVLDKGTGFAGWSFNVDDLVDGDIGFHAYYSASDASRNSSGGLLAIGRWSHVVATWDGSSLGTGIRLYVDGTEVVYAKATDATGARPDDLTVDLGINCVLSFSFPGDIDDVQLYDRVLDPNEVARL